MEEELPELKANGVVSIVWDYDTDTVEVDCEGLNRMEVIGLLHTALDQLSDEAYWVSSGWEVDDDEE